MYRTSPIIQIIFVLCVSLYACQSHKENDTLKNTASTTAGKELPLTIINPSNPYETKVKTLSSNLRIVSTAPSITEFLFELGLGNKIVGVSKFCNFPKESQNIPKVGGHTDPDLETIIALKPTIVVGVDSSQREKTEAILTKSKIRSIWMKVETVDDVLTVPETLAKIFKIDETRNLSDRMRSELEPILVENQSSRPSVLVIFGLSPIIAAGPGTFMDELIKRAGGKNIMQSGMPYPQLDNEKLIALDPMLIIDASFGEHPPLPSQLRAMKDGNVVRLKNNDLMRPSPRIGQMFSFLKTAITKASK